MECEDIEIGEELGIYTMICENDVNYLKRICEETGAPEDIISKYNIATVCAEFAARHYNEPDTMAKWDAFYARMVPEDADAMFEVNGMFGMAKEKGISFLDIASANLKQSYMEVANSVLLFMYRNSGMNAQGRLSVNNMKYACEIKICLAEGNRDAFYILTELENTARGKESGSPAFRDQGYMMLLGLDDMGMRGRQIVYARDYYDGNMQAFYDGIRNRSGKMIEYVNKRAAMEYDKDPIGNPDYLAASGGASSTRHDFGINRQEFHIDVLNAPILIAANVEPIKIDYSKMDIRDGIDRATGIRIAKAHGFEPMFELPYNTDFGEWVQIVMINRKTGDMLSANTTEDNMVYGGCKVIAPRREGVNRAIFSGDIGVHGNCEEFKDSQWKLWECGHQEGCFAQHATMPEINIDDVPWDKYPYKGMVSMPIPEPVDEHLCWSFFNNLPDNLVFLYPYIHNEAYEVPMMANLMLAPGMIRKYVPENCIKYFCRMLDDPAKCFAESVYLGIFSSCQFVTLFKMSVVVAGLRSEEIILYKEAVINVALKQLEIAKNAGRSSESDVKYAKKFVNDLRKLEFVPDALDLYIVSKFYDKIKEPSADELPQNALAWMKQNAPVSYAGKDDWFLYGSMRYEYQLKHRKGV